ncbi:MAG: hypothetical protein M1827_006019 [Pycnora praestabilis]|nr:MAG: hypothetical protein M1827_006019 [Pycnora praestabilis]
MVQFWSSIPASLHTWALKQPVFFTASAPTYGQHVNCSPKGLPAATFTIFAPNKCGYVDATGSGSETITHVYENGRVTIMFCSFGKRPRIMRLFCKGSIVEWDSPRFEPLLKEMGKERIDGARAIVLLDVFKVQTSCGYGVPFLSLKNTPSSSPTPTRADDSSSEDEDRPPATHTEKGHIEPILEDRKTMGHWSHYKVSKNEMMSWHVQYNRNSLDGLRGLRVARRDGGECLMLGDAQQKFKSVAFGQWQGIMVGILIGMLMMAVLPSVRSGL